MQSALRNKWTWVLLIYLLCGTACQLGWIGAAWMEQHAGQESNPPSLGFLMGTDHLGRDLMARLLQGTRIAIAVGLLAAGGAVALGTALGILSGWYRGWIDGAILWLSGTVVAIPGILLVIAIASIMGKGFTAICTAFALVSWVSVYRLVRAETQRLRTEDFIWAAKAVGAPPWRIFSRHIIPHLWPLISVQFSLAFVWAIQTEAVLSFLGVGLVDEPSWGGLIADAWAWNDLGQGHWWRLTGATLALAGLALSVQRLALPSKRP